MATKTNGGASRNLTPSAGPGTRTPRLVADLTEDDIRIYNDYFYDALLALVSLTRAPGRHGHDAVNLEPVLRPSPSGEDLPTVLIICNSARRKAEIEKTLKEKCYVQLFRDNARRYGSRFQYPPVVKLDERFGWAVGNGEAQNAHVDGSEDSEVEDEGGPSSGHERGTVDEVGYRDITVSGHARLHLGDVVYYDSEQGALPDRTANIKSRPNTVSDAPVNFVAEAFISLDPEAQDLCGAPLLLVANENYASVQSTRSTCGGVIYVGEQLCALTTCHGLFLHTGDAAGSHTRTHGEKSLRSDFFKLEQPPRRLGDVVAWSAPGKSDWVLINIDLSLLRPNQFDAIWTPDDLPYANSPCEVWTPQGPLEGVISAGFSTLQLGGHGINAFKVRLNTDCLLGDSGSWIVRRTEASDDNRDLFKPSEVIGYVVAASTEPPIAYGILLYDVLRDISRDAGIPVKLPDRLDRRLILAQQLVYANAGYELGARGIRQLLIDRETEPLAELVSLALNRAVKNSTIPDPHFFDLHPLLGQPLTISSFSDAEGSALASLALLCPITITARTRYVPVLLPALTALGRVFRRFPSTKAAENVVLLVYSLAQLVGWVSIPLVLEHACEELNLKATDSPSAWDLAALVRTLRSCNDAYQDFKYMTNTRSNEDFIPSEAAAVGHNLVLLSLIPKCPLGTLLVYTGPYTFWYATFIKEILGHETWLRSDLNNSDFSAQCAEWVSSRRRFPRILLCLAVGAEQEARLVYEPIIPTMLGHLIREEEAKQRSAPGVAKASAIQRLFENREYRNLVERSVKQSRQVSEASSSAAPSAAAARREDPFPAGGMAYDAAAIPSRSVSGNEEAAPPLSDHMLRRARKAPLPSELGRAPVRHVSAPYRDDGMMKAGGMKIRKVQPEPIGQDTQRYSWTPDQ